MVSNTRRATAVFVAHTCRKLGLNRERVELDLGQFRPGLLQGQSSLF